MGSACGNPRNGEVLQPLGELSQDLFQARWPVRICGVARVGSLDCLGSSASHALWFSPSASRWTSQQPHVFEEKASP